MRERERVRERERERARERECREVQHMKMLRLMKKEYSRDTLTRYGEKYKIRKMENSVSRTMSLEAWKAVD